jgi:hypothetical protein
MANLTTLANVKGYIGLYNGATITGVTLANPCVITAPNHGIKSGTPVLISGIQGTVELNGNTYTITVIDQNSFSIGIDSSLFTAYLSGGLASTDDILLARLITSCSDFIESWLNRTFAISDYIEVRDGSGTNRMMFANYPVISVSSVKIRGNAIPLSDGYSYGYRFDSHKLWLVGSKFPMNTGDVYISYSAGYATVPPAIEQVCIELVATKYFLKDRIGISSKMIAGESVYFSSKDLRDDARSILANYTKVIPV